MTTQKDEDNYSRGDDNRGCNNKDDENQGDESQDDGSQDDENQDDENQDDESQDDESQDDENQDNEEYWAEMSKWELEALTKLRDIPQELQDRVIEFCDLPTLAMLSRVDREWNKRCIPLMWRNLDFSVLWEEEDLMYRAREFFLMCDAMIDARPERWKYLSSFVRELHVGRLIGGIIVRDVDDKDLYSYRQYEYFAGDGNGRNVFHVIAEFTQLEALSLYLKNCWGMNTPDTWSLKNLKSLDIGGQVPQDIMEGFFHTPESLEHLSVIMLHQVPGQLDGPDGVTCFTVPERFTNLKTLHLCKLADLDGRNEEELNDEELNHQSDDEEEFPSGMRWRFPREADARVLGDWANLLSSCSSTLEEVTLENRYLTGTGYPAEKRRALINPGVTDPVETGAHSIRESQTVLFPIFDEPWPKLRKLTLIGMGDTGAVSAAMCHLEPQVEIEHRAASTVLMEGDVTPEEVGTPTEFSSLRDAYRYQH